jgi:hypothetical protein
MLAHFSIRSKNWHPALVLRSLIAALTLAACARAWADQTAPLNVGSTITISVTANGTQPFNYQWKRNGVAIPGETESSLVIDSATADDVGSYTVVLTNSAGSTESDAAILSVAPVPPSFSSQPTHQVTAAGTTVNFSAVVIGTPPITFRWQKDGVNIVNGPNISGADTASLTITNATFAYNGRYALVASNVAGVATSDGANLVASEEAILIINPPPPPPPDPTAPPPTHPPAIATQPVAITAYESQTVSFTVNASGTPTPTYQWRKDGVNLTNGDSISGANFAILTLSGVRAADAGNYSVVITNSAGTVTSNSVPLTINNNTVTITSHPVGETVNRGVDVLFISRATGLPTPTYQWQKNGVNLANGNDVFGATTNVLFLTNVSYDDAGNYAMVATNSSGSRTSNAATLTINGTPIFLTQPAGLSVVGAGSVLNLAVTATGDPAPTLQWRKNGANLANGGAVSGVTTNTLTLTGVTAADAGIYSVVATNSQGTATSLNFEVVVLAGDIFSQPVAAGKSTAISSPGATGNLQWQVSTDAGNRWTDLSNDGPYTGATSDTLRINNVSTDLSGNIYRLVSNSGGTSTVLRTAKLTVSPSVLPFPVAVSADGLGNIYVTDTSTDTVQKVVLSTTVSVFAGTAGQVGSTNGTGTAARFNDPSGIVASSDGSMAVSDTANATIRVITSAGAVSTLAGSTSSRGAADGTGAAATFSSPTGIARDSGGNYFVADATNHTIRKVTSGGVVTTFAGTAGMSGSADGTGGAARFNNPTGVDVDSNGNVYVSDTTNNLIRKISPAGVVTTLAGLVGVSGTSDGQGANALFNRPTGLVVTNSGNVYVADTGNSTIREITAAGMVSTYAGMPGVAGLKDGTGIFAWFNQPLDISLASDGALLVADTGNAVIRRITSGGVVATLALSSASAPPTPPTLPEPPTLPSIPSTPTPPSTPTIPAPGSGGKGGGGGAPSLWFLAALAALAGARRARQK